VARATDPAIRAPKAAAASHGIAFILKKSLISALVALVLFSLMIGVRTEAGPEGQLIYWTRFGDLAAIVAAVFFGSIVVELLRQWMGPSSGRSLIPATARNTVGSLGRFIAPALLIFALLVR
jgi:branched-chain amino acid transport system permease protein